MNELINSWDLQIEVHLHEYDAFHLKELFYCIDSIAKLNILFRLDSIYLIVLATDEQASYS